MGGNGGGVSSTVIGGIGLFADGTAAAPSISFLSDPDTGVYRAGANILGFTANGAGTFNMSRSGASGFLSNPSSGAGLSLLDAGSIALTAAGTAQNITLTPSTTGYTVINGGSSASYAAQFRTNTYTPGSAGSAIVIGFGATSGNTFGRIQASDDGDTSVANLVLQQSGGAVLIGTTTDNGALFQVNGSVSIGNTVAAAVAVASTHKVTMLIGGVTYYLLASNV